MMTDVAAEDGVAGISAGPARAYVCPAREQLFLMPVSMRDWLEEGHLAFFVLDVVGELDTSALHRRPGGCTGRPPYEPEMMLALLLYAYCCGIRSSRRIEAHCRTDAAFRVICGGLVPDHATIARFVVEHERALEGLFVEGCGCARRQAWWTCPSSRWTGRRSPPTRHWRAIVTPTGSGGRSPS
jgi:transposase